MSREPIEYVSEEQLSHFIQLWIDDARNRPCLRRVRWYSVRKDGRATAVDNSTNDLWVEDFATSSDAVKWLCGEEIQESEAKGELK